MSDIAINADRVFDLTGMICDGSASASELAEMDAYLLADQQSCDRYMGYCWMHVALTMELQIQRAVQSVHQQIDLGLVAPDANTLDAVKIEPPDSPAPTFLSAAYHGTIGFFSQELPFSLLIAAVLTSLGLWFASMIYVSSPDKIARDSSSLPSKPPFDPTLKIVGRITGMVDCKWADPNNETFNGANVLLGRKYGLASGLMEITYDTGAKVILQGPVTYEVESNGGYLSVGKLTGKLEKKLSAVSDQRSEKVASGQWSVASEADAKSRNPKIPKSPISNPQSLIPNPFCIHTPTATVTDIGTEFGVDVTKGGGTETSVFAGEVAVNTVASDSQPRQTVHIKAGESILVESGLVRRLERNDATKHFARTIFTQPQRRTILTDDFNGNSFHPRKWHINTWLPVPTPIPANVVAKNGRVEFTNQGYLITVNQYDPERLGGIEITGRWTFAQKDRNTDILYVLTRCSGDATGTYWGEASDGVEFRIYDHTGEAEIGIRGNTGSIGNLVQTGKVVVHEGDTFQFRVIDCGTLGLSITVTQVGNPSNTASATAVLKPSESCKDYGHVNHVVFHNATCAKGSNIAYLDDVAIVALAKRAIDKSGASKAETQDPYRQKGGKP